MTNGEIAELGTFLCSARARMKPRNVGLPAGGQRRVKGLRRNEVAELADISEAWYARFEAGRATLSVSAIERVAVALRLDAADRARLLRLARPDIAAVSLSAVQDSMSGLNSTITAVRDLARSCASASSVIELSAAATRAVIGLSGPGTVAYMREFMAASAELPIVAAAGPNAERLSGHRQRCATVAYAMEHFRFGQCFGESDIRISPCVELRTRVQSIGVYAYHTQPIMDVSGLRYMLGVALPEPRAPSALELRGVEVAAAIVELTLGRSLLS